MKHISYHTASIDGGQCKSNHVFLSYGSPQTNKFLTFLQYLLATSMEPSSKMLWRNGEFLIWATLGPHGLKVDVNKFSKDFSTFYVLHVLV